MGFPDKEPVRRALMDAAKEKYGHFAEGRAGVHAKGKETDGWALTPEGMTWIRENEKRITSTLGTTRAGMPFGTRCDLRYKCMSSLSFGVSWRKKN